MSMLQCKWNDLFKDVYFYYCQSTKDRMIHFTSIHTFTTVVQSAFHITNKLDMIQHEEHHEKFCKQMLALCTSGPG